MTASEWISPILSFAGAGLGASLSYVCARAGVRQQEAQSRREEWGRRFTAALDGAGQPEPQRRLLGLLLLDKPAHSSLVIAEGREFAEELLVDAARCDNAGADLRLVQGGPEMDALRLIEERMETTTKIGTRGTATMKTVTLSRIRGAFARSSNSAAAKTRWTPDMVRIA